MSDVSEDTVAAYKAVRVAKKFELIERLLANALRDTLARALKAEYTLRINDFAHGYPAKDRGHWTFEQWQAIADKELRGEK